LDALAGDSDKRIGLSNWYANILILSGIAWALNSCQTFMFIYCLSTTSMAQDIESGVQGTALLGSSVFIGSFVGSFIFGNLADIKGRKPVFLCTLLVAMLGSALCAISLDLWSMTVSRFVAGIGLGGKLPVICTLVQELAPSSLRGRSIVFLESFWAVGCLLAVFIAYGIAPQIGWRATFGGYAIFVFYCFVIQYKIPESPKWLATVGRHQEAIEILCTIEKKIGKDFTDQEAATAADHLPVSTEATWVELTQSSEPSFWASMIQRFRILYRYPYFTRTLVLWTIWTGISLSYYAIYIYLPDLIGKKGFRINGSWDTIVIIILFQIPGYLTASYFVETIGRRKTFATFLMGSFVSSIALGYVEATKWPVMIAGSFLSFFMLGSWGCLYAYTPENYPTSIRAMGSAYANGVSRIGAFLGPYLVPPMVDSWGFSIQAVMWTFGGVLCFLALILVVFGFEPKGKDVDAIERIIQPIHTETTESKQYVRFHEQEEEEEEEEEHFSKKGTKKKKE
jgi:putative MFS transporter